MAISYSFYGISFVLGAFGYFLIKIIPWLHNVLKSKKALKPLLHVKPHWLFGHIGIHPGPCEQGLMTDLEWVKIAPRAHTIHIGPLRPILELSHPDTVKQILKTTEPKSTTGVGSYGLLLPWIGEGLLISSGEKWFRNRRLLTPGFHFDILKPYANIYNSCAEIFMDKVEKQSAGNQSVEIYNMVTLLTLDVILKCAFSYDEKVQEKGVGATYVNSVLSLSSLIVKRAHSLLNYIDWIYYRTNNGKIFKKHCNISHTLAEEVIESRKEKLKSEKDKKSGRYVDFLDILLLAKDDDGKGLTDREIRNEVETFMFEGHDTTASGITWALYNLARHPEYQRKAQTEIDGIIGERNPHMIEWEDLNKLEYLTRCIKESLRLHPSVLLISRELTQPMVFENHLIPETTLVDINIWNVHHNPTVWGPNNMMYDPDRFLPDKMKEMDSHAFIPFSAGPRNCIGQNFAMNEMKTSIARILHKYELSVDESHHVEMLPEITLKPKNGIKLFFKERNCM